MTTRSFFATIATVLVISISAAAVDAPPVMSEVNRLKIQVLLRDLEISQLRAQAAQKDFEASKANLTALISTLDVKGYTLNVQTQTYEKNPEQPVAPK